MSRELNSSTDPLRTRSDCSPHALLPRSEGQTAGTVVMLRTRRMRKDVSPVVARHHPQPAVVRPRVDEGDPGRDAAGARREVVEVGIILVPVAGVLDLARRLAEHHHGGAADAGAHDRPDQADQARILGQAARHGLRIREPVEMILPLLPGADILRVEGAARSSASRARWRSCAMRSSASSFLRRQDIVDHHEAVGLVAGDLIRCEGPQRRRADREGDGWHSRSSGVRARRGLRAGSAPALARCRTRRRGRARAGPLQIYSKRSCPGTMRGSPALPS